MIRLICALAVALAGFGGSAGAVVVFTDRVAWEAALTGTLTTETFSTNMDPGAINMILDTGIITEQTGSASVAPGLPHQAVFADNSIGSSVFAGFVNQDGPIGSELTWTMPGPISAFGADFYDLNGSPGLTVTADFDGTGLATISIGQLLGSSGFFGIIGDAAFSSLIWRSNDGGGTGSGEAFRMDNFAFNAVLTPTPVPLPAAFPMLLVGLAGLGLVGRRRRRA